MDFQTVIVALFIVGAFLYAGRSVRRKIGAFRPKNEACGANCGCQGPAKVKN